MGSLVNFAGLVRHNLNGIRATVKSDLSVHEVLTGAEHGSDEGFVSNRVGPHGSNVRATSSDVLQPGGRFRETELTDLDRRWPIKARAGLWLTRSQNLCDGVADRIVP